jgi:hypothetical protein
MNDRPPPRTVIQQLISFDVFAYQSPFPTHAHRHKMLLGMNGSFAPEAAHHRKERRKVTADRLTTVQVQVLPAAP